jgi:hypothetical protein
MPEMEMRPIYFLEDDRFLPTQVYDRYALGRDYAGLDDALFWGSLAGALFLAFWAALPVNRWLIARGRGHAAMHAHHAH